MNTVTNTASKGTPSPEEDKDNDVGSPTINRSQRAKKRNFSKSRRDFAYKREIKVFERDIQNKKFQNKFGACPKVNSHKPEEKKKQN